MIETASATIYSFDNFELDSARELLVRLPSGEQVHLTTKAFSVLAVLVENSGELVTKRELMRTVWPDSFVEEANLTQTISVLRKALGETRDEHRFIVTESGRGYRFVAPVRALSSSSVTDSHEKQAIAAAVPKRSRAVLTAVSLLAMILVCALYFWNRPQPAGTQSTSTTATAKAIAVLPFKGIETVPESQLLGIGMADAIITKLSQIKSIVVRQTSSVMRYADSTPEAIRVGREINVDAILEGSIQKVSDRIRVSVRLFRVSDGALLWAENFDERDADIFALQDSISERVANSLSLKLNADERDHLKRRYTENIEAYNLYQKGRFFWNKRYELRKSIELYEQALALDANYALAYSGIADSYVLLQFFSHTEKNDFFQKAKAAAEKALSLDADLAEPHAALAMYQQLYEWNWEAAEAEFKLAIAANPNYATAHQWYGEFLTSMGRYDESIRELEKAVELDPLSISTNTALAQPYLASERYAEAIEKLKPALELDGYFTLALLYMGRAYDGLGNYKEALAYYQKNMKKPGDRGPYFTASIINSYVRNGQKNEAEEQLNVLKKLSENTPVSNYAMARGLAPLGYKEEALGKLEKAVAERDGLLIILAIDRNFDNLRSEPRFQKILRDMKFNN